MKKKHIAILTTVVLAFSSAFFISSMPVFASGEESTEVSSNDSEDEDTSATNGDYDYTKDEEYTQSFYRSKSLFQSSYEYEEYCKQMYNMGYMDSDYEWTPAAQNFINNMTGDNMKALDENAKEIVQQRIENGEMKEEDNPYLTYDQKQALIKKNSGNSQKEDYKEGSSDTYDDETSGSDGDNQASSDSSRSNNTITVTPEEEQAEQEGKKPSSLANHIKLVFMALLAAGIALVTYSIYKKQF